MRSMVVRLTRSPVLAMLAASLTILPLMAGCFGPGPFPLQVELRDIEFTDDRNVTLSISYMNDGDAPLEEIWTSVVGKITYPNGSLKAPTNGTGYVMNYPETFERYFTHRGSVFNNSDILSPAETHNVSLHVHFPADNAEITEGDLYTFLLRAVYVAKGTEYSLLHMFPCYDANGNIHTEPHYCSGSVSSRGRPSYGYARPAQPEAE